MSDIQVLITSTKGDHIATTIATFKTRNDAEIAVMRINNKGYPKGAPYFWQEAMILN